MQHIRLDDHIRRPSGNSKTVCVTACLTALGIPLGAFHSTSTKGNVLAYEGVIRRNGFALRSRLSSVPKGASVGKARLSLCKLGLPEGSFFVVLVRGHLILLDRNGQTVIDTDPRTRDSRKIIRVHAVWKK